MTIHRKLLPLSLILLLLFPSLSFGAYKYNPITGRLDLVGSSSGGGTPGGSTTQVQYNNAGAFGGVSGATSNGTVLTLTNPVIDASSSGSIKTLAGSNPTISAAGALSVDTSATSGSGLRFFGDAQYTLPGWQRISFVLDTPTTASDYNVASFPANITIRQIRVLGIGGTNIVGGAYECDTNGVNCSVIDSDITATSGTVTTDDGSLSNPTIDANEMLQWQTTSVSGSMTAATVSFYYTYDSN